MQELRIAFAGQVGEAGSPADAGAADGRLMFMTPKKTPAPAASCALEFASSLAGPRISANELRRIYAATLKPEGSLRVVPK